jgi:hypothetical protein
VAQAYEVWGREEPSDEALTLLFRFSAEMWTEEVRQETFRELVERGIEDIKVVEVES